MMANGRFMISRLIDKGSFGEIYEGHDVVLNRSVAIKMVYKFKLDLSVCRSIDIARQRC